MTTNPTAPYANMIQAGRARYRRFLQAQRAYRRARDYLQELEILHPDLIRTSVWLRANDALRGAWERVNTRYDELIETLRTNGINNPGAYLQDQPENNEPATTPVPPVPAPGGGAAGTAPPAVPPPSTDPTPPPITGASPVSSHYCGSICRTKDGLCARLTMDTACYQHIG